MVHAVAGLLAEHAWLLYACGLLFAGLYVVRTANAIWRGPLSALPGPFVSKATNLLLKQKTLAGRKLHYVHDLHRRYGPIVRISPTEVSVADTEAARHVHGTQSGFRKSPFFFALTQAHIMFSIADPKEHSARRRLLAPAMSESGLKPLEPYVTRKVALAMAKMEGQLRSDGFMDVLKWWHFMATDVIGELSFGEPFGMLEVGKECEYSLLVKTSAQYNAILAELPFLAYLSFVPALRRLRETNAKQIEYADLYIRRYRAYLETNPSESRPMLFAKLLKARDAGGLTDLDIRGEAKAYMIAGSDTTANTLTYLIWAVCRSPDVRRSLLEAVAGLPEGFGHEELKGLSYLEHVLDETLRLYGAALGGLPRIAPPDGAVICGHHVPGGMTVTTQAYTLHRDPSIFPEPERFLPSRWAAPTQEMKHASMAFGIGPTTCIGMHLARMEMRLAVAHFFRAFPAATMAEKYGMTDADMEIKNYFLISPQGGRCLMTV